MFFSNMENKPGKNRQLKKKKHRQQEATTGFFFNIKIAKEEDSTQKLRHTAAVWGHSDVNFKWYCGDKKLFFDKQFT